MPRLPPVMMAALFYNRIAGSSICLIYIIRLPCFEKKYRAHCPLFFRLLVCLPLPNGS